MVLTEIRAESPWTSGEQYTKESKEVVNLSETVRWPYFLLYVKAGTTVSSENNCYSESRCLVPKEAFTLLYPLRYDGDATWITIAVWFLRRASVVCLCAVCQYVVTHSRNISSIFPPPLAKSLHWKPNGFRQTSTRVGQRSRKHGPGNTTKNIVSGGTLVS